MVPNTVSTLKLINFFSHGNQPFVTHSAHCVAPDWLWQQCSGGAHHHHQEGKVGDWTDPVPPGGYYRHSHSASALTPPMDRRPYAATASLPPYMDRLPDVQSTLNSFLGKNKNWSSFFLARHESYGRNALVISSLSAPWYPRMTHFFFGHFPPLNSFRGQKLLLIISLDSFLTYVFVAFNIRKGLIINIVSGCYSLHLQKNSCQDNYWWKYSISENLYHLSS